VWMRFLFSLSIYLSSPLFSPPLSPHNSMSLFLLSSFFSLPPPLLPAPPTAPSLVPHILRPPLSRAPTSPHLRIFYVFSCAFFVLETNARILTQVWVEILMEGNIPPTLQIDALNQQLVLRGLPQVSGMSESFPFPPIHFILFQGHSSSKLLRVYGVRLIYLYVIQINLQAIRLLPRVSFRSTRAIRMLGSNPGLQYQ
jgi:hypothetical protein